MNIIQVESGQQLGRTKAGAHVARQPADAGFCACSEGQQSR